jgi:hypothetical protein
VIYGNVIRHQATPLGLCDCYRITQGRRRCRQPWAVLGNGFAVAIFHNYPHRAVNGSLALKVSKNPFSYGCRAAFEKKHSLFLEDLDAA